MALRNIPNSCRCSAVRTSVLCTGLGEQLCQQPWASPSLWDRGCWNKGGLSSGWEHRTCTKNKWSKRSGSCENTAKFCRSAGSQDSCRTWLFRQRNVCLSVPLQTCCSVVTTSGVTSKFFNTDWEEPVVFQRLLSSNSSTEAQLGLPPPGQWFVLTILTKEQSESW